MNERSDQSVFVTQFVVYGAPGFVKLEAFDMEPVRTPGTNAVAIRKGTPVRIVMPESSFVELANMLNEHLSKNDRTVRTSKVSIFSQYAETVRIHMRLRREGERKVLEDVAGMFDRIAANPAAEKISRSLCSKLDKFAGTRLPDACNNLPDELRSRLGKVYKTLDTNEALLFTCLACYVVFCEAGTSGLEIGRIRELIGAGSAEN